MKHTTFFYSPLLMQFDNLTHACTTQNHGNIAFHVNDNIHDVITRHKILAEKLGYNYEDLLYMKQIHSDHIHIRKSTDTFYTPVEADALITNQKNKPIMVMSADCTAVLLYAPEHEVIAVAHVGRQGAMKGILTKLIHCFQDQFCVQPREIYAATMPNICTNCYEINATIAQDVITRNLEYSLHYLDGKIYLDIRSIIQTQLLDAGVLPQHIESTTLCNCCQSDQFYSYRKDANCGRFGAILML